MAFATVGCNTSIYVRDGVTDGDTFYLAPQAFADDDDALQSWVTYSLMRSTCQLQVGGENPARVAMIVLSAQIRPSDGRGSP